tara:strand:- start:42 stop:347 length:306 start_codon:yes stop_codon:yes gene_type:complete
MYRPLPSSLTIKSSDIEGLGLFTNEFVPSGTNLGISHYFPLPSQHWPYNIIRTPLGGFYNQSDDPNCRSLTNHAFASLITLRDVEAGEELTTSYSINPLDI